MKCKLCRGESKIVYSGKIRKGLSSCTLKDQIVYQCTNCNVIWNEAYKDENADYYESGEYREGMDQCSNIELYHRKYDKEVLQHFEITGTDIFRDKNVCDIGCGGELLRFYKRSSQTGYSYRTQSELSSGTKKKRLSYLFICI